MKAVLLLMGLVLIAASAAAQSDGGGVVVRTTLKPESGAVIGQHVRLLVDVLFPGEMPRPPRVSMPDAPGAQIVRYETQATTMNERIEGREFVGQRFEFSLYPRRGGALDVPAPLVTLLDRQGDASGHLSGKASRLDVTVPAGVDPSRPVIASTRLTLDEQWSPAPTAALKAGDALVRTITRTAADVPGMAMLDLGLAAAPPDVRVYLASPQIDDRQDRGDVTGHRVDKVTYVFERGGSFILPGVAQPWWDLEARRLRIARTSEVTVAIATAPAAPIAATDRAEGWIFAGATAAGVLALAWWAWPRLRTWQAERHARWLASEPKAFADLEAACRYGDAAAIYRTFTIWRGRTTRPVPAVLAKELELVLFADASWSGDRGRAFANKVAKTRRPNRHPQAYAALPPLNPAR